MGKTPPMQRFPFNIEGETGQAIRLILNGLKDAQDAIKALHANRGKASQTIGAGLSESGAPPAEGTSSITPAEQAALQVALVLLLPDAPANAVIAGPTSGEPGRLGVRSLVAGDMPASVLSRKVGITIDGGGSPITTGVKGSIQVDFAGTIIGWSVEADRSGSIAVEIDKHSGTQTVPVVPNTTTDKISASAPIALSSGQAAGVDATGVSSWSTAVAQWDSIQFNVVSVSTVQRVTLYLRIQES